MRIKLNCLSVAAALLLGLQQISAAGYHYTRPSSHIVPYSDSSHHFAPLPTVAPLPPVPDLPPLPTARPQTARRVQTQYQSLVQVHPTPKSVVPPHQPTRTYIPPTAAPIAQVRTPLSKSIANAYAAPGTAVPRTPAPFYGPPIESRLVSPFSSQPQQPINYGNTALGIVNQGVGSYPPSGPDSSFYIANGRQLKQYEVVEIIDNDIKPIQEPFLKPFFDSYRASIGASGTGAVPMDFGSGGQLQIQSRSDALGDQQQRTNALTLGSGGLGYITLPNGKVFLGSGSLGYSSAQQRSQLAMEARTRSGAPSPDALHFGHGPLGGMGFFPFQ